MQLKGRKTKQSRAKQKPKTAERSQLISISFILNTFLLQNTL